MQLDIWAQTDVGLKREANEDSILIDKNIGLFIVADGMGGHEGGEVASALAVQTVQKILKNKNNFKEKLTPEGLLKKAYREASYQIYHKGHVTNPELMGMGTTMVLGYLVKSKLYIANVGDSRGYLFRDSNLWQLTEDHSLVNEQVKAGLITEDDMENVVGKNVITRSVGYEVELEVDIHYRVVNAGDIYLFCSDGLSGMVPFSLILDTIKHTPSEKVVPKLINLAKKGGGDDNISVILIKFT